MKKLSILLFALFLVVALAFTLTACDNGDGGDQNQGDNNSGNTGNNNDSGNTGNTSDDPCELNGHEWVTESKKNATCYREGSATYVCEVCSDEKTEVLPMTAHKIQKISAKEATCTSAGRTAGERCRTAGCSYSTGNEVTPMLPHSPVITPASEPTCVDKGYTPGIHCSSCYIVLTPDQVDAEKYPELAAMEPSEAIDELGHNFVDGGIIEATCASEGYMGGTRCSRCGQIDQPPTKIADKLTTHPEYIVVSVADCMNNGYSKCPICGDEQISSYKDADKHVWTLSESAVAPDCVTQTNGKTAIYKCSVAGCDTIIDSVSISWELLHDSNSEYCSIVWQEIGAEGSDSFAATTEHAGELHGECSACSEKFRIDIPIIDDGSDFNEDNNIYPEDVIGTPVDNSSSDDEDEESAA